MTTKLDAAALRLLSARWRALEATPPEDRADELGGMLLRAQALLEEATRIYGQVCAAARDRAASSVSSKEALQ